MCARADLTALSKIEMTAMATCDAADNLVQLYKRILLDHKLNEALCSDFLRRLSGAAGATLQRHYSVLS